MLLANGGCKKQVSKAALRTRCSLQNLQETSTAQIAKVSEWRQELAQSLVKVEEDREADHARTQSLGKAEVFAE